MARIEMALNLAYRRQAEEYFDKKTRFHGSNKVPSGVDRVARFSLAKCTKTGEIHQTAKEYTYMPNDSNIDLIKKHLRFLT
jgi:hypothetical protein